MLFCIYFQVDRHLCAIVELAHRLVVALSAVMLRVDFVVHIGLQGGEPVAAILADDIGFHGAGACIGEINNCVG